MRKIGDALLQSDNGEASINIGSGTSGVVLLKSPAEINLDCTDESTYQVGVFCTSNVIPTAEMIANASFGNSPSARVIVYGPDSFGGGGAQAAIECNTGLESSNILIGSDYIQLDTKSTVPGTNATLYNAQPSGDLEIRADGTFNLYADYSGAQTGIFMSSGSIELNSGGYIKLNNTGTTLVAFADDADAGSGGLTTGMMYQTDGTGASPLNVAGIVMIKQ